MIRAFRAHCQEPTYAVQQIAAYCSLFDHLVGAVEERG
jgi:hypothetical protein